MAEMGGQKASPAQWFDPLGPDASGKHGTTGGRELRERIFSHVPGLIDSGRAAANRTAWAARDGAASFAPVRDYGQRVLRGDYLNGSPQLDRALAASRAASDRGAQNAMADARANFAGQSAGIQSQFARNGMSFGTANQQATEASRAALEASMARGEQDRLAQIAAQESQARLQNYMSERAAQAQAPATIAMAAEKPFQMLSTIPDVEAGGLTPAAGLVSALAGGGQATTDSYYKPGVYDHALAGLGAANSLDI